MPERGILAEQTDKNLRGPGSQKNFEGLKNGQLFRQKLNGNAQLELIAQPESRNESKGLIL